MTDMEHMRYLAAVAGGDLSELRRKEETYQGSWKRRGGVGAFMMMARKWDRLETILKGWHYDIFSAIRDTPSGVDGTVLAEVRDLRRYLLLVEAEMASIGAVAKKPPPTIQELDAMLGNQDRPMVPRYEEDDQLYRSGTPEDGGHHARQCERLEDGLTEKEPNFPCFMVQQDGVIYYLVDRELVATGDCDHLPRLPVELNLKEWEETLPEYRSLYLLHAQSEKWLMRPQYRRLWGEE